MRHPEVHVRRPASGEHELDGVPRGTAAAGPQTDRRDQRRSPGTSRALIGPPAFFQPKKQTQYGEVRTEDV